MTTATEHRHAWFPASPCDASCVRAQAAGVGRLRMTLRVCALLLVVGYLVLTVVFVLPTPRVVRRRYLRSVARMLLGAMGIHIVIDDRRPFPAHARGLIVANHVSFLDVLAIASVSPAHFVAKSDVMEMGAVSALARALGVIPVDRGSLRKLPSSVDTVVEALHRDKCAAVFAEGTTWCGRSSGRFRPAFFQAAIDAGVPVLPMTLEYTDIDGKVCTAPAFIGDDEVDDTMGRVLAQRSMTVTVVVHELQLPVPDRRYLATRCEELVFGIRPDELGPIVVADPERPYVHALAG
ncbi:lysophospholipid acyltransferase family protein [Gordonia sp. CPCC 205333]|uniref:lysophospholipid acyltransferase family protein n=1 Tax=Gordonia sp. CPCC 205333 TaxID=3140790 RepID=UPI003AF3D56A